MTAAVILAALLVGFALGAQLPRRRRFNAGVAAGRRFECRLHGWHDDPALKAQLPRQRRWSLMDRQVVSGQPPRVLDDMPKHR